MRSRVKKPWAWRILPWPPQVAHTLGLVPDWAPLPVQDSQVTEVGILIGAFLPPIGLFEGEFHVVAQIGAALASRAAAAAPAAGAAHAEEIVENIGEGGGEIGAEAMAAATLLEGGMAEAVIGGALVAVLEHLVGLVDFLESMLAIAVAGILSGCSFMASLR